MAENNSWPAHEAIVSDNPPTPEQLFRLAARARVTARETNKNYNAEKPYTRQELYLGDGVRRVLSVSIGPKALKSIAPREWWLNVIDTSWYDHNKLGVRDRFDFVWNNQQVTRAEHHSYFVPAHARTADLYHDLEHFAITDDFAAMQRAEQEISMVTAKDCSLLLADVVAFCKLRHDNFSQQ